MKDINGIDLVGSLLPKINAESAEILGQYPAYLSTTSKIFPKMIKLLSNASPAEIGQLIGAFFPDFQSFIYPDLFMADLVQLAKAEVFCPRIFLAMDAVKHFFTKIGNSEPSDSEEALVALWLSEICLKAGFSSKEEDLVFWQLSFSMPSQPILEDLVLEKMKFSSAEINSLSPIGASLNDVSPLCRIANFYSWSEEPRKDLEAKFDFKSSSIRKTLRVPMHRIIEVLERVMDSEDNLEAIAKDLEP